MEASEVSVEIIPVSGWIIQSVTVNDESEEITNVNAFTKNIIVNENIEIFITSQKNFKGIKVGIIDSQNRIRYIQDRGRDLVEHRFKIEKEGKYDVFIEMEDKKDVKIVGMINIDDD